MLSEKASRTGDEVNRSAGSTGAPSAQREVFLRKNREISSLVKLVAGFCWLIIMRSLTRLDTNGNSSNGKDFINAGVFTISITMSGVWPIKE